jgi:hypothetical protein
MTSEGKRAISETRLLEIFLRNLGTDPDFEAWVALLRRGESEEFILHPVSAAHLIQIYSPRLTNLERKSSALLPSLSRALQSIGARSTETLMGILHTSSDSGTAYMAWLSVDANELVAYFVAEPKLH